jgi:hypothetical protein
MQQHMHTSRLHARSRAFITVVFFISLSQGLGSLQGSNVCVHAVFSCCVLQNIKTCKESVLEAAQLYVDEHDDEKVRQLPSVNVDAVQQA